MTLHVNGEVTMVEWLVVGIKRYGANTMRRLDDFHPPYCQRDFGLRRAATCPFLLGHRLRCGVQNNGVECVTAVDGQQPVAVPDLSRQAEADELIGLRKLLRDLLLKRRSWKFPGVAKISPNVSAKFARRISHD